MTLTGYSCLRGVRWTNTILGRCLMLFWGWNTQFSSWLFKHLAAWPFYFAFGSSGLSLRSNAVELPRSYKKSHCKIYFLLQQYYMWVYVLYEPNQWVSMFMQGTEIDIERERDLSKCNLKACRVMCCSAKVEQKSLSSCLLLTHLF